MVKGRKGPRRAVGRSEDLEDLLSLPLFSAARVKQVVRAYGCLGPEAAALLIGAAYEDRFAEYVQYLDEGIAEIGSYAAANIEELESYLTSLSLDLGIVKKKGDEKTNA